MVKYKFGIHKVITVWFDFALLYWVINTGKCSWTSILGYRVSRNVLEWRLFWEEVRRRGVSNSKYIYWQPREKWAFLKAKERYYLIPGNIQQVTKILIEKVWWKLNRRRLWTSKPPCLSWGDYFLETLYILSRHLRLWA